MKDKRNGAGTGPAPSGQEAGAMLGEININFEGISRPPYLPLPDEFGDPLPGDGFVISPSPDPSFESR